MEYKYNDDVIVLETGDVFLIKQKDLKYFFDYMQYEIGTYLKDITEPFFKWYKQIYGTYQYLLLESLLKIPFGFIEKKLNTLTDSEYAFGFIYLNNGWFMVQEKTGVHIYPMNAAILNRLNVFRYIKSDFNKDDLLKSLLNLWNLPFDNQNNILDNLNSAIDLILNNPDLIINSKMKYLQQFLITINNFLDLIKIDSKFKISNIEVIGRQYSLIGIDICANKPIESINIKDILCNFKQII